MKVRCSCSNSWGEACLANVCVFNCRAVQRAPHPDLLGVLLGTLVAQAPVWVGHVEVKVLEPLHHLCPVGMCALAFTGHAALAGRHSRARSLAPSPLLSHLSLRLYTARAASVLNCELGFVLAAHP